MKSLSLFIYDTRNPEIRQQSKFQNSLPSEQGLESYRGGAEQMLVLGNHSLDFVAACRKQPAVFSGACSVFQVFRLQMSQIPDAVVHSFGIVVDERHLLR